MRPILRRDCNYFNLDKVKREAVWNEDQGKWILPEMTMNRTTLPSAAPGRNNFFISNQLSGDKSISLC